MNLRCWSDLCFEEERLRVPIITIDDGVIAEIGTIRHFSGNPTTRELTGGKTRTIRVDGCFST